MTLDSIQDVAIESVIYEEAGMMAANGMGTNTAFLMFGGVGINEAITRAKQMRDPDTANTITGTLNGFHSLLDSIGLGGIVGGMGNVAGFLPDSMGPMLARFGMETSPSQESYARAERGFIFDGSNGYPAIDYAQIGRNYANNVWDAKETFALNTMKGTFDPALRSGRANLG